MKYKTTKKAVMNQFKYVIKIHYCGALWLLQNQTSIEYTTRTEGWAADVYDMGSGVAIVTGYAPFGNIEPSCGLVFDYNQKAREAANHTLQALVDEFVAEVFKQAGK